MPPVATLSFHSRNPADDHGSSCCPHDVCGPAVTASPNVLVGGLGVLRVGDTGVHAGPHGKPDPVVTTGHGSELCCGGNTWRCVGGSATVFVNGRPVVRLGDETRHCGGTGKLVEGNRTVIIGG